MKVELARLRDQVTDCDGTSVVMVGTEVMALSPMATQVLAFLCDGPRELQFISQDLVQKFGAPDEGRAAAPLVTALVEDLERRGIVHVVTGL